MKNIISISLLLILTTSLISCGSKHQRNTAQVDVLKTFSIPNIVAIKK